MSSWPMSRELYLQRNNLIFLGRQKRNIMNIEIDLERSKHRFIYYKPVILFL